MGPGMSSSPDAETANSGKQSALPASLAALSLCPQWDSNPHWADFKSAASANWAMGALQIRGYLSPNLPSRRPAHATQHRLRAACTSHSHARLRDGETRGARPACNLSKVSVLQRICLTLIGFPQAQANSLLASARTVESWPDKEKHRNGPAIGCCAAPDALRLPSFL